ncbi:PspA/IM30 family protein [Xylanibacillus composti]|uniref:Phage shock protein A n=1 Tax=Xylanibacillus composti TaxID=1572762 RepID=A0A8J4H8D5_9BACL|nr:PspA/IM30 family protein [Xylanibacillus composti]MDT9726617.1 PspA/IM30 family protein [Xylanibacillus composti]GIQ70823.1 phage shock protein A [Xylanibacillus composti]
MGILARFKEIMASNIHALLNKTGDPEKEIADYTRTVSGDLGKVKAEMASIAANERRARRALSECQGEIDKLQRYAEKAVEAGNDREAMRFLEMKAAQAGKLPELRDALDKAAVDVSNLKRMQDKLASELSQLEELKVRLAAAKAQQKANARGSATSGTDSAFTALEAKVNQAYDEAMAIAELRKETTDDLDELLAPYEEKADSPNPEQELAAIKEKMKNRQ